MLILYQLHFMLPLTLWPNTAIVTGPWSWSKCKEKDLSKRSSRVAFIHYQNQEDSRGSPYQIANESLTSSLSKLELSEAEGGFSPTISIYFSVCIVFAQSKDHNEVAAVFIYARRAAQPKRDASKNERSQISSTHANATFRNPDRLWTELGCLWTFVFNNKPGIH